jgi:hypothetical protein
MPQDPGFYLIIGSFLLTSIGLVVIASLHGWRQWIELKKAELDLLRPAAAGGSSASTASRIEVADLKERVKKLEAIAAGIDI